MQYRAVTCLAAVVVFCTTYALILPAITLEKECQIPEHTHTEACFTQVTTREKRNLTCMVKADTVIHHHDSACYDAEGKLWCPLPEVSAHVHGEDCYTVPAIEPPHVHTAECYARERGELICTESTEPVHLHTEECYSESRNRFGVMVYASEGALPGNAVLSAQLLEQGSEAYEAAQQALTDTAYDGFAAMDIHFTVDGEEIEPQSSVYVCINVMGLLPEDADADTLAVQHHEQTDTALPTPDGEEPAGAVMVATVADAAQETGQVEALDNGTETTADVAAAFEVERFSTFTITWTDNGNYVLNLHYVDTAGKDIAPSGNNVINLETVNNTANVTMQNYADKIDHPGYVYQHTYIENGGAKTAVNKLSYNTGKWYFTTNTATDDWTLWTGSGGKTSMDVYLVYQ